jgi:hypothetical protein
MRRAALLGFALLAACTSHVTLQASDHEDSGGIDGSADAPSGDTGASVDAGLTDQGVALDAPQADATGADAGAAADALGDAEDLYRTDGGGCVDGFNCRGVCHHVDEYDAPFNDADWQNGTRCVDPGVCEGTCIVPPI